MKRGKIFKEALKERGQSLTEFAIGTTIIMIMIAAGLDFARAYYSFLSLREAAQEGAAYASIAPGDTYGIRTRVKDTSSQPVDFASFTNDQIDIQYSSYACAGNTVKVKVDYDFNLVAPFIAGNNLHLSAEAIDTILQPPC